jgi:hypothetical protein
MLAGLAIASLLAHLFVTALYAPAMAFAGALGVGDGVHRVLVCTPDGIKSVTIGIDGQPTQFPAPDTAPDYCPICMGLAGYSIIEPPVLSVGALPLGVSAAHAVNWVFLLPPNGNEPTPVSRGPPV